MSFSRGLESAGEAVLMVRADSFHCAFPIGGITETCRPLPVQSVDGMPPFVCGVAVIRGVTTPVLNLAQLLAGGARRAGRRFVTGKVRERPVAFEVDEVLGVRRLTAAHLEAASPLVGGPMAGALAKTGVLDGELLAWLDAGRLVSDELLDLVLAEGWA
ncbi:MAG TPA: chemotaxis protein CheW [Polyangiaceae bacterium]|jgi:purine-binding chemotaxis protein CheW|nr:chemotaxis protein CheW [Polyangiaceae bacterium]